MSEQALFNGFIFYLCFIVVLTFHEWAHAWTAWKCGDDTARLQGRITLNPVAHMDLLGTVILPLIAIFLSASNSALAGFIIGWGKPVPVNPFNLRKPRRDDTLVALAGPAMNVLLAIVFVGLVKVGMVMQNPTIVEMGQTLTVTSLFLCFFNLLPIPPLDGSHVVKNAMNMSWESYLRIAQYGFIIVILVMQIPFVRQLLAVATFTTYELIARVYGI